MKVFDEVLQKEVEVQETITPEVGKELKIDDPKEWDVLKEEEQ